MLTQILQGLARVFANAMEVEMDLLADTAVTLSLGCCCC